MCEVGKSSWPCVDQVGSAAKDYFGCLVGTRKRELSLSLFTECGVTSNSRRSFLLCVYRTLPAKNIQRITAEKSVLRRVHTHIVIRVVLKAVRFFTTSR